MKLKDRAFGTDHSKGKMDKERHGDVASGRGAGEKRPNGSGVRHLGNVQWRHWTLQTSDFYSHSRLYSTTESAGG